MNKALRKILFSVLVLCMTFCVGALAACGDENEEQPEAKTYSLTLDFDGTQGDVTATKPASGEKYAENESVTITVSAKESFETDTVTVNGTAVSLTEGKYTFPITSDTTVKATFKSIAVTPDGFTITVNCPEEQGVVTVTPPLSGDKYEENERVTVTVTAKEGYALNSVTLDGAAQTLDENNSFSFYVTGNVTIAVTFDAIPSYTVTLNADAHGKLMLTPQKASYHEGDVVTVTAKPDLYYLITSFKVNGEEKELDLNSSFELTITGDVTIDLTTAWDVEKRESFEGDYTVIFEAGGDSDAKQEWFAFTLAADTVYKIEAENYAVYIAFYKVENFDSVPTGKPDYIFNQDQKVKEDAHNFEQGNWVMRVDAGMDGAGAASRVAFSVSETFAYEEAYVGNWKSIDGNYTLEIGTYNLVLKDKQGEEIDVTVTHTSDSYGDNYSVEWDENTYSLAPYGAPGILALTDDESGEPILFLPDPLPEINITEYYGLYGDVAETAKDLYIPTDGKPTWDNKELSVFGDISQEGTAMYLALYNGNVYLLTFVMQPGEDNVPVTTLMVADLNRTSTVTFAVKPEVLPEEFHGHWRNAAGTQTFAIDGYFVNIKMNGRATASTLAVEDGKYYVTFNRFKYELTTYPQLPHALVLTYNTTQIILLPDPLPEIDVPESLFGIWSPTGPDAETTNELYVGEDRILFKDQIILLDDSQCQPEADVYMWIGIMGTTVVQIMKTPDSPALTISTQAESYAFVPKVWQPEELETLTGSYNHTWPNTTYAFSQEKWYTITLTSQQSFAFSSTGTGTKLLFWKVTSVGTTAPTDEESAVVTVKGVKSMNFTLEAGTYVIKVTPVTPTDRTMKACNFTIGDTVSITEEYRGRWKTDGEKETLIIDEFTARIEGSSGAATQLTIEKEGSVYTFVWDGTAYTVALADGNITFTKAGSATADYTFVPYYAFTVEGEHAIVTYTPSERLDFKTGTEVTVTVRAATNYTLISVTLDGKPVTLEGNTFKVTLTKNMVIQVVTEWAPTAKEELADDYSVSFVSGSLESDMHAWYTFTLTEETTYTITTESYSVYLAFYKVAEIGKTAPEASSIVWKFNEEQNKNTDTHTFAKGVYVMRVDAGVDGGAGQGGTINFKIEKEEKPVVFDTTFIGTWKSLDGAYVLTITENNSLTLTKDGAAVETTVKAGSMDDFIVTFDGKEYTLSLFAGPGTLALTSGTESVKFIPDPLPKIAIAEALYGVYHDQTGETSDVLTISANGITLGSQTVTLLGVIEEDELSGTYSYTALIGDTFYTIVKSTSEEGKTSIMIMSQTVTYAFA